MKVKRATVVLGALVVAVFTASRFVDVYTSPPSYQPDTTIRLVGRPLTDAQHDAAIDKVAVPYGVDIATATGRLLYLGVHHTNDPHDRQIRFIQDTWQTFKPTVAL